MRDNNGRLLASGTFLGTRGWTSKDVITRAARDLVAVGFQHGGVVFNGHGVIGLPTESLGGNTGADAYAQEQPDRRIIAAPKVLKK